MRRSSKLAERTRLDTWVFMVNWQSSVTPRFVDRVTQGNRCTTYSCLGRKKREIGLSTRGCDHCFSLVVIVVLRSCNCWHTYKLSVRRGSTDTSGVHNKHTYIGTKLVMSGNIVRIITKTCSDHKPVAGPRPEP